MVLGLNYDEIEREVKETLDKNVPNTCVELSDLEEATFYGLTTRFNCKRDYIVRGVINILRMDNRETARKKRYTLQIRRKS